MAVFVLDKQDTSLKRYYAHTKKWAQIFLQKGRAIIINIATDGTNSRLESKKDKRSAPLPPSKGKFPGENQDEKTF